MIPKFRAWIKEEKCFADYIETIRYYAKEVDLCWGGICESDCFDFEGVIFTQSTGLKDKNGKEIFEGDVLTSQNYPVKGVVEFRTDLGLWVHYLKGYSYFEYLGNVAGSKEIIGNIYENPELLEVTE